MPKQKRRRGNPDRIQMPYDTGSIELGLMIADARNRLGLSLDDLAEMVQMSPHTVTKWESGSRMPQLKELLLLESVLGLNLHDMALAAIKPPEVLKQEITKLEQERHKLLNELYKAEGGNNTIASELIKANNEIMRLKRLASIRDSFHKNEPPLTATSED